LTYGIPCIFNEVRPNPPQGFYAGSGDFALQIFFLGVVLAAMVPLLAARLQFGTAGPFYDHCPDGGFVAFAFRESAGAEIHRLPRES